jgi:Na+/proline symporter
MFTVFATWFGAETCIGRAGEAYRTGLSGATADRSVRGLPVAHGAVYAVPLWKQKVDDPGDLFRWRYRPGVERWPFCCWSPPR